MDIPLPPGAQRIEPAEAIRRIQERDHSQPAGSLESDKAIIALIRKGAVITALTVNQELIFWPVDLASGEPFDPDNPEHAKNV